MSKIGVSLNINVTKIEKERLISGAKGKYLDATVFIDLGEADQYGNHGFISQDVSKEERAAGVNGPILGNVKVFWTDQKEQAPSSSAKAYNVQYQCGALPGGFDDFDDDLVF